MSKPRLSFKIWMETDEGYVFGPGVYNLLKRIEEKGTLKEAAKDLDMSYRFAWGLIKKAEETLGESLIEAHKGGRSGGGSTELTETGEQFIREFRHLNKIVSRLSDHLVNLVSEERLTGSIKEINKADGHVDMTVELNKSAITIPVPLDKETFKFHVGDELELVLGFHIESIEKI